MNQKAHTVLALDTATKICSVALRSSDNDIFERKTEGLGVHSELLFVFIEEVLKEASLTIDDIQGVLVTSGPGSYTGLRIAASAVKGLLFNRSIPLYGINTLAYFAWSAFRYQPELKRVHAVIDARRVHLYHQIYHLNNGIIEPSTKVEIRKIDTLKDLIEVNDGIIGTGIKRIPADILSNMKIIEDDMISASSLIQIFDLFFEKISERISNDIIEKLEPENFNPKYYNKSQPQVSKK